MTDCDNCKKHGAEIAGAKAQIGRHIAYEYQLHAEIERLRGDVEALTARLRLQTDTANSYMLIRDQLQAENEALKADAGRYQWLRDQKLDDPEIYIGIDSPDFPNRWALGHEDATKIDAAIDAARSK